jgi:hypothetical protein
VGFTADAGKFFYFLLILFLTLCYWTFFGIQNVQITPSLAIANVRRGRHASASTSPWAVRFLQAGCSCALVRTSYPVINSSSLAPVPP